MLLLLLLLLLLLCLRLLLLLLLLLKLQEKDPSLLQSAPCQCAQPRLHPRQVPVLAQMERVGVAFDALSLLEQQAPLMHRLAQLEVKASKVQCLTRLCGGLWRVLQQPQPQRPGTVLARGGCAWEHAMQAVMQDSSSKRACRSLGIG